MKTTENLVSTLVNAITVDARKRAKIGSSRDWTQAIWDSLKNLAEERNLAIHPTEGPYKGEYHLDFTLWEEGFGPIVGVESQWLHWRQKDPLDSVGWAFDKLQGIKCDLKVFIFDWDGLNARKLPPKIVQRLRDSMCEYQMNSTSEHYVLIWFSGPYSEVFEWRPIRTGKHSPRELTFSPWKK